MEQIGFERWRSDIHALLQDWRDQVSALDLDSERKDKLLEVKRKAKNALESEAKLRVSLLGEFSAGKSSLISALTGKKVAISADVTTQTVNPYDYKGLLLVDTPGVQAETNETAHDQLAREATVNADIVLFVLTNELFNQRLADYFHYIAGAEGLSLGDKTLVIVNKMDRESNKDDVIISEVEKAIEPHSNRVILAAVDYYLKAQQREGELRKRLVERSRVPELISSIDRFVEERGMIGRLCLPLQLLEEALSNYRSDLLSDDTGAQAELELIRRQKRIVDNAQRALSSLESQWTTELRRIILSRTGETLATVHEIKSGEELQALFESAILSVEPELDAYFVTITNGLQNWVKDLQEQIEELESNEFAESVRKLRVATAPKGEFNDAPKRGFDFAKASKTILNEGVGGILDSASKNPKAVKNFVYEVGKLFGKKWRPWEASRLGKRIAQWAGKGGKILGPLMVAIDFYMEYRNEREQEERERHLAKTRLSMQRQFRDMADTQVDALRQALNNVQKDTTQKMIERLEEQAAMVTENQANEKTLAKLANMYVHRSRTLRDSITAPSN